MNGQGYEVSWNLCKIKLRLEGVKWVESSLLLVAFYVRFHYL